MIRWWKERQEKKRELQRQIQEINDNQNKFNRDFGCMDLSLGEVDPDDHLRFHCKICLSNEQMFNLYQALENKAPNGRRFPIDQLIGYVCLQCEAFYDDGGTLAFNSIKAEPFDALIKRYGRQDEKSLLFLLKELDDLDSKRKDLELQIASLGINNPYRNL